MTFYQIVTLLIGSGALIGVFTLVWNVSAYRTRVERNTSQIVATLKGLVSLVKDEGERRLLEAGLATINSPARLNYAGLRALVAMHGRPPQEVTDTIRRIANDKSLDEDWKIIGAVTSSFKQGQLERAYRTHGGTASTFNTMVLMVVAEAREIGVETVLKNAGLID